MEDGNGCCTTIQFPATRRVKVISIGAAGVGKSCLIKRYCEKRFVSKYMATLGIDFGVTSITVDSKTIKVNIFDMGGQPFFYEVRNEFYKSTDGVLLVYDCSDRGTFDALDSWLHELMQHSSSADIKDIVVFVCANKSGDTKCVVDPAEGRLFAETRGFIFYETSAKTGENVVQMFEDLFTRIARGERGNSITVNYTMDQAELVMKIKSSSCNYQILGLERNCSKDDIVKAFKHLAIQLHPDKNSAPGSEDAFKIISRAKDELLLHTRH